MLKILQNKLLGQYINGNYTVKIFDDGTKIRENDLDNLTPSFPESIDITITKKCNGGCKYCYENCNENGKHGDILNAKFIDSLHPYTELALNGNDLTHPDLENFLIKLKHKHIIANMTVNQRHFEENYDYLTNLIEKGYIHGLGVSLVDPRSCAFLAHVALIPTAVLHVVCGVFSKEDYEYIINNGHVDSRKLNLLILGYKYRGRGKDYYEQNKELVDSNIAWLDSADLTNNFRLVCFDNLALEQLHIKDKVSKETWDKYYMGDDGKYTMYIDMVNNEFAKNSVSDKRYKLMDNIEDMFKKVLGKAILL